MLRATLKGLLARKLRLVLSALAVVLGVMFVSGAFVLTDTLGRSFDSLFADVYSTTEVQVHAKPAIDTGEFDGDGGTVVVPAALVDTVRAVRGVAKATGYVSADGARVIGSDGKVVTTFGPPRLGNGWTGETDMLRLTSGRAPAADTEIVVNAGLAKAAGITLGDQVGVLTRQPKRTFTLVGIFDYGAGRASLGGTMEVYFTEAMAQELMLGERGVYSGIDVRAAPGFTLTQVRDAVQAAVGAAYEAKTGPEMEKAQTDAFKDNLGFVNNILLGFAGVALFVGIFLILNTFSIIVAQRVRELALMRALGGSRRQMIGAVMVEALAIGLIASILGLGAGIGIGALLGWLFTTIGGGELELAGIGVPPAAIISSFAVGMLVTLVAALLPALRASRIPPVAALREAATADRPLTRISIVGGAVTAVGAASLGYGLSGESGQTTLLILGGVLVSFIGIALLTPLLARPVVSVLGRLFSWSVPGKLGRLNSGRNPRRTAITAAALMVGVALITGVNTILATATTSLGKLAETQVKADLIISGDEQADRPPTFDPAVIDKIKQIPGVQHVVGEYYDAAQIGDERQDFSVMSDLPALAAMFSLTATSGALGPLGPDEAVLDAQRAGEQGITAGSRIEITFPTGAKRTLTVVGVYADNDLLGGWFLSTSVIPELRVPQPSWGYVQVTPGTPVEAVRKQVSALLADSPEVSVANRDEYVAQQTAQFDFLLTMIQILLALAVLIAVLGIINTLALSVLERTREIGLLRAVGLGRAQSMRMVTVEAVVISVFGALLGVVVGAGMGMAVVEALKDEGFTELTLPWNDMAVYLALAGLVGVVAAIMPAIRTARVNVLTAITYE